MMRLVMRSSRGITYSRQYLQELAIDRGAIKRAELTKAEIKRKEQVYNLKANDKNPDHFVRVRLNHPLHNIDVNKVHVRDSCFIEQIHVKPLRPDKKLTLTAKRRYIITSTKKATLAMRPIQQLHLYDAIETCKNSHKKVAKLMVRTLYNMIDHAKVKGLDPMRLFVLDCMVGLTRRYKSVRYHAKGRGCTMKKDFCHVTITLVERQKNQFFKDLVTGNCPPAIAKLVRDKLVLREAEYKELLKFSGITTAKGRQQAIEMRRRKVDKVMIDNKAKNTFEPRRLIEDRFVMVETEKLQNNFKQLMEEKADENSQLREQLYRKNLRASKA